MNKKRSLIALAPLLFSMTIVCNIPRYEPTERDREFSIEWEGRTREFLVHEPLHRPDRPAGLLFVIHGGSGTPVSMVRLTHSRFNELSDEHGFYVVYPAGVDKQWNDGREIPSSTAHSEKIDDVGLFREMIKWMHNQYAIDPERVFATGISNGGFMSQRLACEASEIKGVVSVTAQLSEFLSEHCNPPRPISVALMNGTADPLVPYDGGEIEVFFSKRGKIISTRATIDYWARFNRCGPARTEQLPDTDPEDETRVQLQEWSGCRNNVRVALYTIQGGGHTWPRGWQYLSERRIGRTTQDFNASEHIVRFFNLDN
ncbi:MAG: hypothetical protein KDK30_05670 [Leptospiraceae bacterium]|nr:hypothetical protein [Leptospiraceae bacterium]MCB1322663.1 hypothetical protein [Leptospiraceae bacterium]